MINISCSEHCFNGLLDFKQAGKRVFKLSQVIDLLAAQSSGHNGVTYYYISNWTKDITGLFFFISWRREKKWDSGGCIGPFQWKNCLNGHKDDGYLTSDKETAESFKGVFSPLSSESSLQELSGEGFMGFLELWLMKNIHNQRQQIHSHPHVSPPTACVNLKLKQSTPAREGRERNNDHMSSLVQPQGDRLVNISLEPELNSFQMKTYISPWRWGPTIWVCLLI